MEVAYEASRGIYWQMEKKHCFFVRIDVLIYFA